MGQVNDAITTAGAALSLLDRVALLFGRMNAPAVRAARLRMRAARRRAAAARALTDRGRQRKFAAARALEDMADVLDSSERVVPRKRKL